MKLISSILKKISLTMFVVLLLWAGLFYLVMIDEIEDETDDVLEDYSAMIIKSFLAGEAMPSNDNGSNNTYYIKSIDTDSLLYITSVETFTNENIYIKYKGEDEPARVLRRVFRNETNEYFELTVATPTVDKDDLLEAILHMLLILFALLFISILLINILTVMRGLSPLKKFLQWLNDSSIDGVFTPMTIDSELNEIEELKLAINSFADRSKKIFEQQKEFIGNASHELQTPIAVCQNRLELLLGGDLSDSQMKDVVDCMQTLKSMSRLNKSLLLLSKIESGEYKTQQLSINELIKSIISDFEEIYQHKNIQLSLTEDGDCSVIMNYDLARTLIQNLIKNAYVHNIEEGSIKIIVNSESITVSNLGWEQELDSTKVFNRFYQGTKRVGTHGLGLSMVQTIARLYNIDIDYYYEENMHNFRLNFK